MSFRESYHTLLYSQQSSFKQIILLVQAKFLSYLNTAPPHNRKDLATDKSSNIFNQFHQLMPELSQYLYLLCQHRYFLYMAFQVTHRIKKKPQHSGNGLVSAFISSSSYCIK